MSSGLRTVLNGERTEEKAALMGLGSTVVAVAGDCSGDEAEAGIRSLRKGADCGCLGIEVVKGADCGGWGCDDCCCCCCCCCCWVLPAAVVAADVVVNGGEGRVNGAVVGGVLDVAGRTGTTAACSAHGQEQVLLLRLLSVSMLLLLLLRSLDEVDFDVDGADVGADFKAIPPGLDTAFKKSM